MIKRYAQSIGLTRLSFSKKNSGGFTLVELLIVLGIFALLTGVVLGNYRTYDSNALFANASEDIVLALRQAQVYGAGAKENSVVCTGGTKFECSYGVYFSKVGTYANGITVFADNNSNRVYDIASDPIVTGTSVVWPANISVTDLKCGGTDCSLDVASATFRRPNPDAFIADVAVANSSLPSPYNLLTITLTDSKAAKTAIVKITRAGQISIQ